MARPVSSITESSDRATIEAAIDQGTSAEQIARDFHLSASAVRRFRAKYLAAKAAQGAPTSPASRPPAPPPQSTAPASGAPEAQAAPPNSETVAPEIEGDLELLPQEDPEAGIPLDRVKIIRAMLLTSMNVFSQEEIARRLNVSERTIRYWLAKGKKMGIKLAANLKPDEALSRVMQKFTEAAARANMHYFQAKEAGDDDGMFKWNAQIIAIAREELSAYDKANVFERDPAGATAIDGSRYDPNDPATFGGPGDPIHRGPDGEYLGPYYTYSPHVKKIFLSTEAHILQAQHMKILMGSIMARAHRLADKGEAKPLTAAAKEVFAEKHEDYERDGYVQHMLDQVDAFNKFAADLKTAKPKAEPEPEPDIW